MTRGKYYSFSTFLSFLHVYTASRCNIIGFNVIYSQKNVATGVATGIAANHHPGTLGTLKTRVFKRLKNRANACIY
ncbi:hypothetical protein F4815DRAFT_451139 [Daldinia loculata]|nr:hypothetical protein F4815DRAFT_451139 [Daldinia loculata]